MAEVPLEVSSRRSIIKNSLLGTFSKGGNQSNDNKRTVRDESPPDEQRSPGNDYGSTNEHTRGDLPSYANNSSDNSNSSDEDRMVFSDDDKGVIFKLEEALADERERGDYFENELTNRTEELKAKLSRRDDEIASLRASLKSEQEKGQRLRLKCDEQRLAILDLRSRMTGQSLVDGKNDLNFEDLLSDDTVESLTAMTKLDREHFTPLSAGEMEQLTPEELVALVGQRESKLMTYETNARIYKETIIMKDREIVALKESLIETGTALESTESQLETMKEKVKVTDERASFFSFQANEYKERLETWLTEANQERTKLHSSLYTANDQVKKREETIAVLRKSLIESLALLKPLRHQVQTSEQDVRGLKRRLGSTQMYAYDLVDKLEKAEKELKNAPSGSILNKPQFKGDGSKDLRSVAELKKELQKKEEIILTKEKEERRLQKELAKAVHHVQKLDDKLKNAESKQNVHENARTVSFADVTELQNLERSLDKKTKTELKKMVKNGHEEVSTQERKVREVSKELEAATKQVEKLQRELDGTRVEHDAALEDLKSNLFLLEEDLRNRIDEIKEKERENNELQRRLEEHIEKDSTLQEELEEKKSKQSEAEHNLAELRAFLDRLKSSPRTKSEIEILEQREELERAQRQLEEERHKLEEERRAPPSSSNKVEYTEIATNEGNAVALASSNFLQSQQEVSDLVDKKTLLLRSKGILEKECIALEGKKKTLEDSLIKLESDHSTRSKAYQKEHEKEAEANIEMSMHLKEAKTKLEHEIEVLSTKKMEHFRDLIDIQNQLNKVNGSQIAGASSEGGKERDESMRTKLNEILEEKKNLAKAVDLLKLDQKLIISERNHALRRIMDDKRLLEKSIREMHDAGQRLRSQLQAPSSQQVGTLSRAYESKIKQLEEKIAQMGKEKVELEKRLLDEGKECATTNSWLQKLNEERLQLRKEVEFLRNQGHPKRTGMAAEHSPRTQNAFRGTNIKVPLQIETPTVGGNVSKNIRNRIIQLHSNQQASIASVASTERSKAKEQLDGVEAKIATLEHRLVEVGSFYQQLATREPSEKEDNVKVKEQELKELQRELAKKERELFRTKEVATDALVQVEIMTKKLRKRSGKSKDPNGKSSQEQKGPDSSKEKRRESRKASASVERQRAGSKRE